MEDVNKKIDALDKFIANENKAKRWTVINIAIFLAMAIAMVYFIAEAKEAKRIAKNEQARADSLSAVLLQINNGLIQETISLSDKAGNYDSLTKAIDTMAFLLKKTQYAYNDSSTIVKQLDQVSSNAFTNQKVELSQDIKNLIIQTKVDEPEIKEKKFIVYVYCMDEYKQYVDPVTSLLQKKGYEIAKVNWVNNINFSPSVKYFHAEDAKQAGRVQALLQGMNSYFKENLEIVQQDQKSPVNQIEVWIGKYSKPDPGQYIKNPVMIKDLQQRKISLEQKKGN